MTVYLASYITKVLWYVGFWLEWQVELFVGPLSSISHYTDFALSISKALEKWTGLDRYMIQSVCFLLNPSSILSRKERVKHYWTKVKKDRHKMLVNIIDSLFLLCSRNTRAFYTDHHLFSLWNFFTQKNRRKKTLLFLHWPEQDIYKTSTSAHITPKKEILFVVLCQRLFIDFMYFLQWTRIPSYYWQMGFPIRKKSTYRSTPNKNSNLQHFSPLPLSLLCT